MTKKQVRVLFILYLLILLKVIVFKYPWWRLREIMAGWQKDVLWEGLQGANFTLFKTIRLYVRHWNLKEINSFGNLVGNVIAFMPFGYLLPRVWKAAQHVVVCMGAAFLTVVGIELFQLLSAFGIFDVDDILLNCLGALLGYLCFLAARCLGWTEERKKSSAVR